MSGDHLNRPVHGTVAGAAYVALPPTAVDATASGPARLMIAWPGFDPPRTAAALAAAIPMTGVPVWRVYLDLPGRSPGGLGSGAILETEAIEAYGRAVEQAAAGLPAALAELRRDLALPDGPVALAGFSAGGAAALLAVARGEVAVSAAAAVAPVVAPARAARAVERRAGRDRAWSEPAQELADRLDLGALAGDIAARDVPLLLVGGARDRVVPAGEVTAFRDVLQRRGAGAVEHAAFRMGHALAAEPGTEPRPPITDAVRVDALLTDWFRERLADVRSEQGQDAAAAPAGAAQDAAAAPAAAASADALGVDTAPYPAPAPVTR
jgi:predicted esterase